MPHSSSSSPLQLSQPPIDAPFMVKALMGDHRLRKDALQMLTWTELMFAHHVFNTGTAIHTKVRDEILHREMRWRVRDVIMSVA